MAEPQVSTLSVLVPLRMTLYQMSLPGIPHEGTTSDVASAVLPGVEAAPDVSVIAFAHVSLRGGEHVELPEGVKRNDLPASAAKLPPAKLVPTVPLWFSTPVVAA